MEPNLILRITFRVLIVIQYVVTPLRFFAVMFAHLFLWIEKSVIDFQYEIINDGKKMPDGTADRTDI
jgi:hypothetical protein